MAIRANVKALLIAPDQSATVLDRIGDAEQAGGTPVDGHEDDRLTLAPA